MSMLLRILAFAAIIAAALPGVSRIARRIDNYMLEERRPNRRDTWLR